MSLEGALTTITHDPAQALGELIRAWGQRRDPAIADLVDALDAKLTGARPLVDATTADDRAWKSAARRKDPVEVGWLLRAPLGPNAYYNTERLAVLARQTKIDPRLATGIVRRITANPYENEAFWWTARTILKRLGDARVLPSLRSAIERWPAKGPSGPEHHAALRASLAEIAGAIERAAKKRAPLDERDRAALAELRAAIQDQAPPAPPAKAAKAAKATRPREVAAPGETGLAYARALLEADQLDAALVAALEFWRLRRYPEVAALVEQLGARVERDPLPAKPAAAALDAWLACERAADPIDVDRLVAALRVGTVQQMIERLDRLAERPADPRLFRAGLRILEDQPFSSKSTRPLYTAAVRLVDAAGDPRAVAALQHIAAHRLPGLGAEGGVDFRDFFAAKVERALQVAARVPVPPEIGDADAALTAAILARTARPSRAASDEQEDERLRAAIYAAPADDSVRQVYADWLLERGRPHGELIALQLARHLGHVTQGGEARERALIAKHTPELLGPLAPAIQKKNLRFERGFVAHAEIPDKRSPLITAVATHPAWATVTSYFAWTPAREYHPTLIAHLEKLGARSLTVGERNRKS